MKRTTNIKALGGVIVIGLTLSAFLMGQQLVVGQADQPAPTPFLTEFDYAPVVFGSQAGPTATATLPGPTVTPFATVTIIPAVTASPTASPTTTPTATSTVAGPTATVTATPDGTVTPTRPPDWLPTPEVNPLIVLENHSTLVDERGMLTIRGEVLNQSSIPVRSIRITTELLNAKGRVIQRDQALTLLDRLAPGERTCFSVTVIPPNKWRDYSFGEMTYQVDPMPISGLELFGTTAGLDDIMGWYGISGQVRNTTTTDYKLLRLVGTLYDASGAAIGCDFAYTFESDLSGGQTDSFELLFADRDYAGVADWRVQVEGERR